MVTAPGATRESPPACCTGEHLVEAGASGKLTGDGKARLERLLMSYWRERLDLPELRMADALMRLKAHADAGALLRALE